MDGDAGEGEHELHGEDNGEEDNEDEDQGPMAEMPVMHEGVEVETEAAALRRSSRQRVFNRKYEDFVTQRIFKMTGHTEIGQEEAKAIQRAAFGKDVEQATEEDNLRTLEETLRREDGEEWRKLADEEMTTIKDLGTFELV